MEHPIFNLEMILPAIGARMIKSHQVTGFRIKRRDVRTFEAVAVKTGQGKVFWSSDAAMFLGNDVVRFVREKSVFLGKQAILTTISRTLPHLLPDHGRNMAAHELASA